jgi:hypothetical protein
LLADRVFTCYEAGTFGYSLHRKLEKLGVTNYVVRPRDWEEDGKKVKTDNGKPSNSIRFALPRIETQAKFPTSCRNGP